MAEVTRLERVDLRDVWPNEASDFTPWLADNLDALGDALGLDIELGETEAAVGSFSLDIRARDSDNRAVVIENQLESTNHDHLGKMLTYAAGYDAGVVVWVAREFRDEHRAALDWLNQRTGLETELYGVVVRAVRIDNSRPAYVFDVVARPNEFRKRHVASGSGQTAESQRLELKRQFLQRVADKMRDRYGSKHKNVRPQSWLDFPIGITGIVCRVSVGVGRVPARVALYIDTGEKYRNEALFDLLHDQKEHIEQEFGETFDWEKLDGKRASLLALRRPGNANDSEAQLDVLSSWMAEKVARLRERVVPIVHKAVADLDADGPDDAIGPDVDEE